MTGFYWYLFDKVGNYKAVVKKEFLILNFEPVKGRNTAPLLPQEHVKYVCIIDCETNPRELQYTVISRKFTNGKTYIIKKNNSSPLVRYIYEDSLSETYISCVNKTFVDENFVPHNKEYNIYLEIDILFDKIFF